MGGPFDFTSEMLRFIVRNDVLIYEDNVITREDVIICEDNVIIREDVIVCEDNVIIREEVIVSGLVAEPVRTLRPSFSRAHGTL